MCLKTQNLRYFDNFQTYPKLFVVVKLKKHKNYRDTYNSLNKKN